MKIYTRKGDDGTTGLLFGGRVAKDSAVVEAYGTVDEAQAAIGVARAEAEPGSELEELLIGIERDLWVLMGELATAADNRQKLGAEGVVSEAMVVGLEPLIDSLTERFPPVEGFVIPGQNRVAAALDLACRVVRRAERRVIGVAPDESHTVAYLNRLSDLLWTMARWQEGESLPARRRAKGGGA